jgi:hypothetical protein
MGLTIRLSAAEPGLIARVLPSVAAALQAHDLPAYDEPDVDVEAMLRGSADPGIRDDDWPSFPYGWLHFVRRIGVHLRLDPAWSLDEVDDPDDDDEYRRFGDDYFDTEVLEGCHLYCHSDSEGLYVPIEFPRVISGPGVPGGFLGSSQHLLRELTAVGQKLGFDWRGERPPDREMQRAIDPAQDVLPLFREKYVFAQLYEIARLSVAWKSSIVFM